MELGFENTYVLCIVAIQSTSNKVLKCWKVFLYFVTFGIIVYSTYYHYWAMSAVGLLLLSPILYCQRASS